MRIANLGPTNDWISANAHARSKLNPHASAPQLPVAPAKPAAHPHGAAPAHGAAHPGHATTGGTRSLGLSLRA